MKSEYGEIEYQFSEGDKFHTQPTVAVTVRIELTGRFFLRPRLSCSAIDGESLELKVVREGA